MKKISKVLLIAGFAFCLFGFSSCEKETTTTDHSYGYNDDDDDFWKKNMTNEVETTYVETVSFSN